MTTLPQLIANAVETNPDGVALVLADGTGPLEQVGYADLDAWSSRLARALIARGIGPEDLVAVAIPRSLDAVLAVWAVAKTGAGFVPIDPAYPPGWVAHLLVDAGAVFGLAVSWVRNELPDEIEWLHVDTVDTARSLEEYSADAVTYADRVRPLRADHPAYVSYVSDGETSPDGVVVTQAGLSGLCAEQQGRYRVEPEDRTLNFAPMPSDSSVLELLLALGGAATMVVVSPLVSQADELTALLRRTGATHAYLPPDALRLIEPAGLDELGVVVTGRRPCPPELVGRWAIPVAGGSARSLYQGYGPAETTVMTSISSPLIPGGPRTIGAPIRGVTARVLDDRLAPVPDGGVGELYLGGPQLARGYHRRPGRTAQLLVADPFADDGSRLYRTGDLVRRSAEGDMEYVGRVALPALDGPGAPSRPNRDEPLPRGDAEPDSWPGEPVAQSADAGPAPIPAAGSATGSAEGPRDTGGAADRWRAGELPDYEQSLPIRDPAADPVTPDRAGAGPGYGYGEAEPVPGPRSTPGRPSLDELHDKDSRLASEKRDLDLPGRGYLEMPDRQHTLSGRGHRGAGNSLDPASVDGPSAPGLSQRADFDSPDTETPEHPSFDPLGSMAAGSPERTDFDSPRRAASGPAGPPLPPEDSASDAWLNSGRRLSGPGDGQPAPIPADATAFFENPQSAEVDPYRPSERSAPVVPAQPLLNTPDQAPVLHPVEPQLPSRAGGYGFGDGPAAPEPLSLATAGSARAAAVEPPPAVDRPASIPLSPGQLRLWERNQTAPDTAAETITAAMSLTGTLDGAAMQAAVADVVDRHETLRTVYPASGGAPHQVLLDRELAVPEVVAEPVSATELAGWLHTLSQTDFDAADPEQVPVRFALAELGPREHVVAVVVHRILADDVSAGLLLRDLLRAFLGRRNRSRPLWQPLPIQYLDYFLGRRAELGDIADPDSLAAQRLAYWRDHLAGLPPRPEFAGAVPPGATGEGAHTFDIGTRTHRRIAEIAQRAGTSEFIVLRTAFAVLLARSSGVTDIVLGSSVRGGDERELDDAIGPYANTVVLRTRIDPAESFFELVQRVAESDRRAFANADLPFELLTAALGVDGPLFDVSIALRHNDIPRLEMPSLATEPVEVAGSAAGAGLRLVIDPHRAPDGSPDGIAAALYFAADRIGGVAVAEVARRFQRVLTVAGGDPDGPVGDIDLLSRADLDRLLVVWNDTRYPVAPELLLDGYRRTVAIRPDTVVVAGPASELTYQEFDARVNQLARRLIEAGVGAETPVGVALRCSPDLVVAIYAVLTAGGVYLPLDPDDPVQWNAQLIDTVVPACLLVEREDETRLAAALRVTGQSAPVLVADTGDLARYSAEPVRAEELIRPVLPDNPAWVLCASAGADGPELAVLSHAALNNQIALMLAQNPLGFTDVYLQRNAATSDTSLWGFFLPLRAGAQLVLADPAVSGDARQVVETITAHGVTVTDFGPAQLAAFADLVEPGRVTSLREIFVTGEPLSPDTVTALRTRCGARVHNLYGTCETAVSATSWPAAGSAERSVPIGLPQWNTRVYVLDSRLRPVPPGVPGELYIAGDQLSRGYVRRSALTADRFVANPFGYGQRMYRTGDLVLWRDATASTPQRLDLLGRSDGQLRFRGHRIRPDAIAALLETLPDIAAAAVLPRTSTEGVDPTTPGGRLVAYLVPGQDADDPDLGRVRAALAGLLPASLVPAAYQVVERIPVDTAGEPDRSLLPDPDEVPVLPPAPERAPEDLAAVTGTGDHDGDTELAGDADDRDHAGVSLAEARAPHTEAEAVSSEDPAPPQAAADSETSSGAEVSGELPATPTAIRLLGNPLPGVEVRSVVLDLPADQPLDRTEAVVRALVGRHPMLSARLDSSDQNPTLWIPPRDQRGSRQYWWLGPETGENTVATDDVVQAAADALDPATGRNIHFVVTGSESARRLVVVANGLVVDDRSWRVLVDELIAGDTTPAVPESRLPQLVQALDQRARSIDLLDEAGWWRRNLASARTAAPMGAVDLRPRRRVSLAITAEGTSAVTVAADAYAATVPEVLLTAVAIAMRTGRHGAVAAALGSLVRCDADARTLVGRGDNVVGGFATEYPLSVQIADLDTDDALVGGPAAGVALTQIRDLVRSVPGEGAGYALLRYLNAETSAEFAAADSGRFTLRYRDLRPARVHTDGPADGVPLSLTVDVTDEGLLCRFDYATGVFVGEDVKTFAEHWVRALGGLAEHGLRPRATPEPVPASESGASAAADPHPGPRQVAEPAPRPDSGPPAGRETTWSPSDPGPLPDRRPSEPEAPVDRTPPAAQELPGRDPLSGPETLGDPPNPADFSLSDAEKTSLLRPVTDAQRSGPDIPGLPQRRTRATEQPGPSPEAAGPAATGLPQRRAGSENGDRSPESHADHVPGGSASAGAKLPRRRPEATERPADTWDQGREATASGPGGLPRRQPRSEDGHRSAESPAEPVPGISGAGVPGLPQRRPRVAEPPNGRDQQLDAAASAPSELPRRRGYPGDSPSPGSFGDPASDASGPDGPGLPQRSPVPPAESAPAGGEQDSEAPREAVPSVLPQRRPLSAEQPEPLRHTPEAPPAPLPQRRPAASEPAAVAPPLPQRRPEPAPEPRMASESAEPAPGNSESRPEPIREAEPDSTADPEPTTFLRPVTDVETTAYLSPILDIGSRDDAGTLLSLFDDQVERTPAVPAVRQGARLLSYAELDRKSRALSVELIRFGVGAQTPVAVAMRPGIDLVVAVCAVLRAGGAYVPVDPGRPAGELDGVLASAAPICVLSISDDGVTTGTGIPVVAIDLLYLDLPTDPAADPVVSADDIADIRYLPETDAGVAGTHRQLVERLRRAQRSHPYDSDDLVLHAAPTIGDITLWELFRPLHSGAQILMPDHPGRAADLSRSIAAHKVTIVHVVPALLERFLDSVSDGGGRAAHPSLRRVVVDGAALPPGGVERFMALLPGAELVIWYGHNETGVITVGSVGGRPVTNDRVYLLDERLRPVPPGSAGEMYIGGPQLARGYYDAPGSTAGRFVASAGGGRLYRTGDIVRRRDGVLEYLGRVERHGGSLTVGARRGGHD
ncbi:AMP-binding protein [Nocardia sp. NPDC019395]|uniref:AMP-binding protein n=1 Tax=Nocardia sp. NPDC019395 TaxID=3154686 RepID=UPI0033C88101